MNKEELEQTVYNISRELQTNFAIDELCALEQEIDRLNNIISELEKWLKEKQILYGINQQGFSWGVCGDALNKLKELKEKENE